MGKTSRKRGGTHAGPIVPVPTKVTSRRHARRLTTQYHEITRRMATATSDKALAACHEDLERMGGVKAYQAASALNTALNPTSRWVVRALRNAHPAGLHRPPRVLEIGAVNTQLLDADGLAVRSIDLHTLDARIEQCDFLSLAHGGAIDESTGHVTPYDAVVCSMVLNCVPNERKRFDMLLGIRAQLRARGRAFITIPRTCLTHSFTLTESSFVDALTAVGLRRLDPHPVTPCSASAGQAAGQAAPCELARGQATKPPDSNKIAYFECEATLPSAEAALRCQRARFETRKL